MKVKNKAKAKSRILEAGHETAGDRHRLGFIDKRKMRKFDVLVRDPITYYCGAPSQWVDRHEEQIGNTVHEQVKSLQITRNR